MADTTYAQQVGAQVRAELARRGLRQTQIAPVIDRSQAALSARLSGAVALNVEELALIARHLQVHPADLLPGVAAS